MTEEEGTRTDNGRKRIKKRGHENEGKGENSGERKRNEGKEEGA